jgi:hypothetical protein
MAIKQERKGNTIDSSFRQRVAILCEWLPKHSK